MCRIYEIIQKKYPQIIHDNVISFDCEKGWNDLIERTCDKLIQLDPNVKILQLKEKFGGLRIYISYYAEEIEQVINDAEEESFKICERCGSRENVTSEGGWIKTLCKVCREQE